MAITLVEKLMVIPTLGVVLFNTAVATLTGFFRGEDGAGSYLEHVKCALVRNLLGGFTVSQLQWIQPPFVDTYKSWCIKKKIPPEIIDIPNTKIKGFWVGPKSTAQYTMVYFHGGGYVIPGLDVHLDLALRCAEFANNNLAVFFVSYSLSPSAPYPTALGECVEALRYILSLQGHNPGNTLIGGDSAGGALTLAVLSHLSHPHPQSHIVKPLSITADLKGAILISPWTSSDVNRYPSVHKFQYTDIVCGSIAQYWGAAYRGFKKNVSDDEYIYAALAPANWWKPVKCEQILQVVGEHEVLLDANTEVAKKLQEGVGKDRVKYVIGRKESHVKSLEGLPKQKLIELGDTTTEGAIRNWIRNVLN